jgi:hypothetical protein
VLVISGADVARASVQFEQGTFASPALESGIPAGHRSLFVQNGFYDRNFLAATRSY